MPSTAPVIAFRVDASIKIGSGHMMRCLTLALHLKKMYNAICHFITRPIDGKISSVLEENIFPISKLSVSKDGHYGQHPSPPKHASWLSAGWESDALETRALVNNIGASILIVDHYAIDYEWQNLVNIDNKLKMMVIDDIADRPHNSHLLVDYTLNRMTCDYHSLVNKDCLLLTGLKYALLREEFSIKRRLPVLIEKSFFTIFVNMGGVDKNNVTLHIVNIIKKLDKSIKINIIIVVGENYQYYQDLQHSLYSTPMNYELHQNVNNISELMRRADLAISAVGSTTWELFSQGIPCILLSIAENQHKHLLNIQESNLASVITDFSARNILDELNSLIHDIDRRSLYSRLCYQKIDARGLTRVSTALLG